MHTCAQGFDSVVHYEYILGKLYSQTDNDTLVVLMLYDAQKCFDHTVLPVSISVFNIRI